MSDVGDAILFACGGAACHVVGEHRPEGMPVVQLNPETPREFREEVFAGIARDLARGAVDDVEFMLEDMRVVFVYTVLGGDMGAVLQAEVADRAHRHGCKVVTVAGIPLEVGTERRERAIAALDGTVVSSDRVLVLDGYNVAQLVDDNVRRIDSIFRASAHVMESMLDNLAQLVEGPFFSTFPEKVYTFSHVSDMEPARAVARAMEATAFPTDPAYGKMIVTVSAAFGPAQLEQIFETVVESTGIMPDIVKRDDREDTKVLVFLPVRLGPSSPRASRS
ncbi:MAG: hypothetical protein Q4Q58_05165 [Thermoplasmata archaeon]|nr:hypothetical protein [Thermoplasmata archaeon]